jgi:hypothetical protein
LRQRHAEIINSQQPGVEPLRQMVQSTVQHVGGRTPKAGGRLLDGRTWDQMPKPQPQIGGAPWGVR